MLIWLISHPVIDINECTYVHSYVCVLYLSLIRDNINTGHDIMDFATNASLGVQTPAVDFVILNRTVSFLCI